MFFDKGMCRLLLIFAVFWAAITIVWYYLYGLENAVSLLVSILVTFSLGLVVMR